MGRCDTRTLTPEEARSFYDRFGTKQDSQAFYESRALNELLAHGRFSEAASVFEYGCGTGRFALRLLRRYLPSQARYRGIDISTTMVRIASARLAPFASRAFVTLATSEPRLPAADASVDRFVSTYVFDLLPESSIAHILSDAKRILRPGGLLCLAGITHGSAAFSRIVMSLWQLLFKTNPHIVGGCRPISLGSLISAADWRVQFHNTVVAWGVASEIVVASPVEDTGSEA